MSLIPFMRENPLDVLSATQGYIVDAQNAHLYEEVNYLSSQIRELQEDMLAISDAFDNVGWSPLPQDQAAEIPLATVKKVAELARAMNAMNPFIKRGVNARISYVWGKGVTFDGIDDIQDRIQANRKKLFSPQAYEEFERVLATDGNAFTALPLKDTDTAFRITLNQIVGAVSNPDDVEEIWLYKREFSVSKTNGQTGEETTEKSAKYYMSMAYYEKLEKEGKNPPRRFNKFGVEQNYIIQHTTVNRQVGWRWGVPDIMPVIFWAKAYKEYLEDNAMLVKAYSRLAWQVKSGTAGGAANAATVLSQPQRDPLTGELNHVGGSAVMGSNTQLSPIAATGSSVDFDNGSALAAAIASGLEVSKVVITSDPGSGNRATAETLDLPTLKAMESRQNLHTERFLELFEFWGANIVPTPSNDANKPKPKPRDVQEAQADNGGRTAIDYAVVTWPQIETDTTKDRITAVVTSAEAGIIYKQEARKEILDVLNIAPYKPWDDLPTMEDDPAAQEQQAIQQENADREFQNQQELTKQTVIAKQGVSGGLAAKGGAQTTNNASRDNRKKDTGNS
jgi:hypothetical protein